MSSLYLFYPWRILIGMFCIIINSNRINFLIFKFGSFSRVPSATTSKCEALISSSSLMVDHYNYSVWLFGWRQCCDLHQQCLIVLCNAHQGMDFMGFNEFRVFLYATWCWLSWFCRRRTFPFGFIWFHNLSYKFLISCLSWLIFHISMCFFPS